MEKEEYESVVQSRDALSGKVRKIIALDKEIAENQGKIQKLEVQAEGLVPWMSLSVPMNYEGTMQTAMMIGRCPGSEVRKIFISCSHKMRRKWKRWIWRLFPQTRITPILPCYA